MGPRLWFVCWQPHPTSKSTMPASALLNKHQRTLPRVRQKTDAHCWERRSCRCWRQTVPACTTDLLCASGGRRKPSATVQGTQPLTCAPQTERASYFMPVKRRKCQPELPSFPSSSVYVCVCQQRLVPRFWAASYFMFEPPAKKEQYLFGKA